MKTSKLTTKYVLPLNQTLRDMSHSLTDKVQANYSEEEVKVLKIKYLLSKCVDIDVLCDMYNVGKTTVRDYKSGRRRKDLTDLNHVAVYATNDYNKYTSEPLTLTSRINFKMRHLLEDENVPKNILSRMYNIDFFTERYKGLGLSENFKNTLKVEALNDYNNFLKCNSEYLKVCEEISDKTLKKVKYLRLRSDRGDSNVARLIKMLYDISDEDYESFILPSYRPECEHKNLPYSQQVKVRRQVSDDIDNYKLNNLGAFL
jgi:hypothetical protein